MGTTSSFLKLRSKKTPKVGEWNINYAAALQQAKAENKFIVTLWTNGDCCGYCVTAEKCMMTDTFKNWMKSADAYFVVQCGSDKDKGKTVHDWVYKGTGLRYYPGFRVTLYNSKGVALFDQAIEGNKLRKNKVNDAGAREMINGFNEMFTKKTVKRSLKSKKSKPDYKIRLNEKLTVAKVNKILDAIDKCDGYCPCQPQYEGSKCHCEDFLENKGIGEPCICNIYVKQKKGK